MRSRIERISAFFRQLYEADGKLELVDRLVEQVVPHQGRTSDVLVLVFFFFLFKLMKIDMWSLTSFAARPMNLPERLSRSSRPRLSAYRTGVRTLAGLVDVVIHLLDRVWTESMGM